MDSDLELDITQGEMLEALLQEVESYATDEIHEGDITVRMLLERNPAWNNDRASRAMIAFIKAHKEDYEMVKVRDASTGRSINAIRRKSH